MLGFSFKLQFLLILVAVTVGFFYTHTLSRVKTCVFEILNVRENHNQDRDLQDSNTAAESNCGEKVFTKSELAKYNGDNGAPLYLALLGLVYDVTKGRKHYGIGCSYNFFVGRDASVSFITGEFDSFDEQAGDDVNSLKPSELLSLLNWKSFYDREYIRKGKLTGRFYDESGIKTKYFHNFDSIVRLAEASKAEDEKIREIYPDCNIEWSMESGSKVWCTNLSGGKDRGWSGYPRKLFEVGKDSFRCACVRDMESAETTVMIKPYDNCDLSSDTCYYRVD